jgi:hypothetical protein
MIINLPNSIVIVINRIKNIMIRIILNTSLEEVGICDFKNKHIIKRGKNTTTGCL